MLLVRALTQRFPLRAFLYLWFFWLQAVVLRVYIGITASWVFSNDPSIDQSFWPIWIGFIGLLVWPLFFFWMLTPFQAPVCGRSGWVWAQIAKEALYTTGNLGIRDKKATWGKDVVSFKDFDGNCLL
ncbi:hypothetical protein BX600DRAFT_444062 [Xylariales sp. PMI_506]|nr:hypothetical protein BX600DRAFT_444062 [Xylariales sp. PMI_506]